MGSWQLGEKDFADAVVGRRILAVDWYETYIDLTVEGGRRIRLESAQPAIPEPVLEAWQHADFMGDDAQPAPRGYHGSRRLLPDESERSDA